MYNIPNVSKIILALYVLTTSFGLIILKLGTNAGLPISYAHNKLQFNINFYSIAGIVLYGISFMLYIYLISKFQLGYIIPLATACVYVVIFIGSYVVFKETFTPLKIAGIALIILGIILLSVNKK